MEINTDHDYIMKLPEVKKIYDNREKVFRVDTQAGLAYEINKKGDWSGNYIHIIVKKDPLDEDQKVEPEPLIPPQDIPAIGPSSSNPPQKPDEQEPFPDEPDPYADHAEEPAQKTGPHKEPDRKKGKESRHRTCAATGAAFFLVAILFCRGMISKLSHYAQLYDVPETEQQNTSIQMESSPAQSMANTEPAPQIQTEPPTEATTPPVSTVTVLTSKTDLLPGEPFDLSQVGNKEIEESVYLDSKDHYVLACDSSTLAGCVSAVYVEAGSCIPGTAATGEYKPKNPWLKEGRSDFLIPISYKTITACPIGSSISIHMEIDNSVNRTGHEKSEDYEGENINGHADFVNGNLVVTLELTDVTVIDWVNEDKEPLYQTLAGYAAVPPDRISSVIDQRYRERLRFWDELPCYIKVSLNQSQQQILDQLSDKRAYSITEVNALTDTAERSALYQALTHVYSALQSKWTAKLGS